MLTRLFVIFFFILGCQSKPTVVRETSVNQYNKNVILVDTRSAFDYTSFHVSGSVNLNSGDFLILKNPKINKRVLDPDIPQIIERLAKRGVSPLKTVLLISDKKDSVENKKWNWLLRKLDVRDVLMTSLNDYRAQHKNSVPQAMPESVSAWEVKNIKTILQNADQCFVNWSDEKCL